MSDASGADVARRLHEIDAQVPIVLMTGFARNAPVNELLDTCCAAFLQRPFTRVELAAVLAAHVRRDAAATSAA